jgi:hypothetical protein
MQENSEFEASLGCKTLSEKTKQLQKVQFSKVHMLKGWPLEKQ